MEANSPLKTFHGVRFVLFGFDPINEQKIRCKLVDCGGVDADQYSQSCTHVIVDKIVYDDPICVAARKDGKTLVTGLWVDHSYDIGMPVDPTSVMYRPLKDLNGIPGAKSFIMCLTGYQRQDRDDIMAMVALMGAQFSKPLVANKITHLICYKFEGEKYELAKKLTKIKLVNHRWLEDCLRAWEILPEADYNKSGYELEMMEAEAKDSEEEAENTSTKQSGVEYVQKSPWIMKSRIPEADEVARLEGLATNVLPVSTVTEVSLNTYNAKDKLTVSKMENGFDHASNFNNVYIHKTLDLQDVDGFRVATSGELPDSHYRTPDGKNVRTDLTSKIRSAEKSPHSDSGKFSAKSYSMKTPTRLGEMSINGSGSSKVPLVELKVSDDLCSSSIKAERVKNRLGFDCVEAPQKEINADHGEESSGILPQKRTMDGPFSSTKSHKMSNDARSWPTSLLETERTHGVPPTDDLHETINGLTLSKDRNSPGGTANLNIAERLHASDVTKNSSSFAKLSSFDLPLSKNEIPESGQGDDANKKIPPFDQDFKVSSFCNMPDIVPGKVTDTVAEMGGSLNHHRGVEGSASGNRKIETKNSNNSSDLNLEGNDNLVTKPQRKKMVAKKTLGSRTKLASTTNQKGSIYLNKSMPLNDDSICSWGDNEKSPRAKTVVVSSPSMPQNNDSICSRGDNEKSPRAKTVVVSSPSMPQNNDSICSRGDKEKSPCAKTVDVSSPTENSEALKDLIKKDAVDSGDNMCETKVMDDETEAPEEKVDEELEKIFDEEMADADKLTDKPDTLMEEKLEYVQHISNEWKASDGDDAIASNEDRKATEPDDGISGKTSALAESNSKGDGVKKKKNEGKSFAVGKSKVKKVPEIIDIMKSKECTVGEETCNENNEAIEMEKEERASCPAGNFKNHNTLKMKLDNNMEVEKENRPFVNEKQNRTKTRKHVEKLAVKSNIRPMKSNKKCAKISPGSSRLVGEVPNSVKAEPAWFVLSGHRLQRKEFQQVIRRLKGRLCRDSHQWSYQATHFITPDPIRRTEKFFAAAASGRWILKTEYLTASSKEGRFLAEEPYEWHKKGLSEDGAINLEAPRKWRLLRERTGHGAFHGMRIIVYGECIAPPLDTLKRAVKAGDGTILATSPPYTRFLDSGVDFAIVSPGMPRVDMWVQEFLKHEIPCVVADYLVEYVCKPGYSLERHVLHKTHAWAEKSFAKVQSRAEEVVEDLKQPPDNSSNNNSEEESKEDDIPCEVCGSGERGEVMLICGNEDGSLGCGVGTHIDCCDPPFEEVPEDDWFCPKCCTSSKSKDSTTSTKKRKKGTYALHA